MFYRADRYIRWVVHGDAFTFQGSQKHLDDAAVLSRLGSGYLSPDAFCCIRQVERILVGMLLVESVRLKNSLAETIDVKASWICALSADGAVRRVWFG